MPSEFKKHVEKMPPTSTAISRISTRESITHLACAQRTNVQAIVRTSLLLGKKRVRNNTRNMCSLQARHECQEARHECQDTQLLTGRRHTELEDTLEAKALEGRAQCDVTKHVRSAKHTLAHRNSNRDLENYKNSSNHRCRAATGVKLDHLSCH